MTDTDFKLAGTSYKAVTNNDTTLVRPAQDNLLSLGIDTYRWKDVRAVEMHASAAMSTHRTTIVSSIRRILASISSSASFFG